MDQPPLIAPGKIIATFAELAKHPTKKFRVDRGAETIEAFVVRFGSRVYAYRNRCAHAGVPLDWAPNEFFDETDKRLLCRTHGALFDPKSGECAGGPCADRELESIAIELAKNGDVVLAADQAPARRR